MNLTKKVISLNKDYSLGVIYKTFVFPGQRFPRPKEKLVEPPQVYCVSSLMECFSSVQFKFLYLHPCQTLYECIKTEGHTIYNLLSKNCDYILTMGEIWLISGSTLSLQKGEIKENIEVVLDSKEICVFQYKAVHVPGI